MSAFGTSVTPYPVIYPSVDVTGATDSTSSLLAAQTTLQNLGQWGTIELPPTPFPQGGIQLNDFGLMPWFNLKGQGKKVTRAFAGLTATTACIIVHARLADYSPTQQTGDQTLATVVSDMLVDANHRTDPRTLAQGGTGNGVHAIYVPNALVDDPNYDHDADLSKSYSSIRALRIAASNGGPPSNNLVDFPNAQGGGGIVSEANRHRFYAEDAFVTGNQWHGLSIGGADPVVGPRTGTGSNGGSGQGHGLRFTSGTNVICVGVNCWGIGGDKRSDKSLGMFMTNTSGALVVGCVFNESIYLTGDSNADRSVNICGCQFRPKDGLFDSNGVPKGTGSGATNCFISVDDLDCVTIAGCDFNTTRKNAFTYNYIINARNDAHVGFFATFNSAVNERPWANVDNVPYSVDQDGSGNPTSWVVGVCIDMSGLTPSFRFGGRGYECFVVNMGANTPTDPTYAGMIGDPAGRAYYLSAPLQMAQAITYAFKDQAINANASTFNVPLNVNLLLLKPGGGGGAWTGTIFNLPASPRDGQSYRLMSTSSMNLTGCVWNVNATPAGQTMDGAPASIVGAKTINIVYTASNKKWYFC